MPALRLGQADQEIIRVRFYQPGQRPVLKLLWPIDRPQQLLLLRRLDQKPEVKSAHQHPPPIAPNHRAQQRLARGSDWIRSPRAHLSFIAAGWYCWRSAGAPAGGIRPAGAAATVVRRWSRQTWRLVPLTHVGGYPLPVQSAR